MPSSYGRKRCSIAVSYTHLDVYKRQVYTREAETADQYIEKFTHENGKKYDITVATSDGLEQVIIRGQGCRLLSARELEEEVKRASGRLREEYLDQQKMDKNYLLGAISEEARRQVEKIQEDETN